MLIKDRPFENTPQRSNVGAGLFTKDFFAALQKHFSTGVHQNKPESRLSVRLIESQAT